MSTSSVPKYPTQYTHDFSDCGPTKIPLIADALDPLTEIFLIDWNLKRVPDAHGLGRLEIAAPPGLYNVRFQTATTVHDELVEIPEHPTQTPIRVTPSRPLEVISPIPQGGRDEIERDRARFVEGRASQVAENVSHGSEVFLCVRDWNPPPLPQDERAPAKFDVNIKPTSSNPGRGVTLYCPGSARAIIDFKGSQHHNRELRLSCANVSTAPGNYLLRAQTGAIGTYEIPLVACEGWQTAVFIQSRPLLFQEKTKWFADITQASILMSRIGEDWDLKRPEVRTSEQAKWALRQSRPIVSKALIEELLNGKWTNPMLGIAGLHLLVLDERNDWRGFNKILTRLYDLIGPHPDVASLALAVPLEYRRDLPGALHESFDFSFPPMLERSWRLVVDSMRGGTPLIPEGSFSDSILDELPRGSLWLCWRRTQTSAKLSKATAGIRGTLKPGSKSAEHESEVSSVRSSIRLGNSVEIAERDATGSKALFGSVQDMQDAVAGFHRVVNDAQKAIGTLVESAGSAQVRDMAKKAKKAYLKMRKTYKTASRASEQLDDTVASELSTLYQKVVRSYVDIEPRSAGIPQRPPKSPLDHLVKSWHDLYGDLSSELLNQLSKSSGLPLHAIERVIKKL